MALRPSRAWLSAAVIVFGATVLWTFDAITDHRTTIAHAAGSSADVLTHHNDVARTGQNLSETTLTLANVNLFTFGKIGFFPVDGRVDAQPLYVADLSVPGVGARNVVYVATEHASLYAFDADSGAVLWRSSMLLSGETPSDPRNCGQVSPEIGITSTPVIDRSRGANGVIYVVAMSKNAAGSYFHRLHAIDLATGAEMPGSPRTVQASVAGTGDGSVAGRLAFDPKQYKERAALLLLNGTIYTTWASHCDISPYTGWIIGYDAATLIQNRVLNITPNGGESAIWMSGGGPAADSLGNVYLLGGNGTFETTLDARGFPNRGDFGNAFLKLSTAGGLAVADYFTPVDTVQQSAIDLDLGTGGAVVLPDLLDGLGRVRHLAVGGAKDKHLYVADRDQMGKWNGVKNNIYQSLALPGAVFSVPTYFDKMVYVGAIGDAIRGYRITNALLGALPATATLRTFPYPGSTPSISANGSADAILWAVNNSTPAVLHAFDARDLAHELYNSSQAPGGRDQFGAGNKFITPTIADGRVFVGTPNGVAVFGLLQQLVPGAPGDFSATVSGTSVALTWSAPKMGGAPTAYVIESGSAAGLTDISTTSTGSTATTLTVPSIPVGTYFVRVRAKNAAGVGAASNEVVVAVGVPGPPENFGVLLLGSLVIMGWDPPSVGGAPTTYVIEASTGPGEPALASKITGTTATRYYGVSAASGTYYLRVRAANAFGASAPSNEVPVTVP